MTHLSKEASDALDEAESFIRGFEGDEMQDGKPEEILGLIAVARLPWTEARHPGDSITTQYFRKGHETGMVTIQDYGGCMKDGKNLRVGSFLPGDVECSPGDTPKTWPEKKEYVADKSAAVGLFETYVQAAAADGWAKVER